MVYCCSICDSFQTYLYLNLKFKTELFKKPRDVLVLNTSNLHVAVKSYRSKTQRGAQHNIYYLYRYNTYNYTDCYVNTTWKWFCTNNSSKYFIIFILFYYRYYPFGLKKIFFLYTCKNTIFRRNWIRWILNKRSSLIIIALCDE